MLKNGGKYIACISLLVHSASIQSIWKLYVEGVGKKNEDERGPKNVPPEINVAMMNFLWRDHGSIAFFFLNTIGPNISDI